MITGVVQEDRAQRKLTKVALCSPKARVQLYVLVRKLRWRLDRANKLGGTCQTCICRAEQI